MNLTKIIDKLHKAQKEGIEIKIPSAVRSCPICKGAGEYKQTYTAGCGMGTYRSEGPCDYCKHDKIWFTGSGYTYPRKKGSVPESVLNQIYYMNKNVIEVKEKLEEAIKPE